MQSPAYLTSIGSHPGAWNVPREPNARTAAVSEVGRIDLYQAVLDEVSHGLIFATCDGEIVFANRTALRECAPDGPLRCDGRQLELSDPAEAESLQRALAAARVGRRSMVFLGSGASGWSIGVVPISPVDSVGRALALLLFGRRSREPLALQFFSQAHHLTRAESAVLAALGQGLRPTQIASAGGVALSTVRTQIRSIREKTRTRSVSDLVQRIEALPPIAPALIGSLLRRPAAAEA